MYGAIVSTLALAISLLTAWLTLLRRGQLKMTPPTMIALVQDSPDGKQKIVIRSLLYCTARRGTVVENMFVTLRRSNEVTPFTFWCYGENKENQRGGGLFVSHEGIPLYHHFVLMPNREANFDYVNGPYTMEVYAVAINKEPHRLATANIDLPGHGAAMLNEKTGGVFFNLNPETGAYESNSDNATHD